MAMVMHAASTWNSGSKKKFIVVGSIGSESTVQV